MHYRNPILQADYSDPDVIRVGEDFYMISSSFTYLPGIPVLHSRDMVHWELLGYAVSHIPFERYRRPVHKCGTWAPSLRYHQGLFYVYVCFPDEGLFAYTAEDPRGPWDCHWVMDVSGWIDPCPLFEPDGTAWLIHGFAASRCGINNILYAHRMTPDGFRILDKGVMVYNGADHGDVTVEGPKWYSRNGQYWILCPAGGVKPGYQLALRSEHILGPYERRIVLSQGDTEINGPHQGGWFDDGHGGDWFIHFQDIGVYGRIPHLQPVDWSSGWPVMGNLGHPVMEGETGLESFPVKVPTSDCFEKELGIQWQWQANPDPAWYSMLHPGVRLYAAPSDTLFHAGQFLSQLMQSYDFDMTVSLHAHPQKGDVSGIGMMGYPYHYAGLEDGAVCLWRGDITEYGRSLPETVRETLLCRIPYAGMSIRMKLSVRQGMMQFMFASMDGPWQKLGDQVALAAGGWTAARPGVFCMNRTGCAGGNVDLDSVLFSQEA